MRNGGDVLGEDMSAAFKPERVAAICIFGYLVGCILICLAQVGISHIEKAQAKAEDAAFKASNSLSRTAENEDALSTLLETVEALQNRMENQ